jgi:molybdenum cofactor synthesis domain-containing protein
MHEPVRFSPLKAAVVTVSDRRSRGEGRDDSGPAVAAVLEEIGAAVSTRETVADDRNLIADTLRRLARKHDLVVTTGGTGLAPRDVTPDATRDVMDREVPGLAEAMRRRSAEKTPHALLSRAVCAVCNQALVINLPGSPRGAEENLRVILPALGHAVRLLQGKVRDCRDEPHRRP